MLILSRHLATSYEDLCYNPRTLSLTAHLLNVNVKVEDKVEEFRLSRQISRGVDIMAINLL